MADNTVPDIPDSTVARVTATPTNTDLDELEVISNMVACVYYLTLSVKGSQPEFANIRPTISTVLDDAIKVQAVIDREIDQAGEGHCPSAEALTKGLYKLRDDLTGASSAVKEALDNDTNADKSTQLAIETALSLLSDKTESPKEDMARSTRAIASAILVATEIENVPDVDNELAKLQSICDTPIADLVQLSDSELQNLHLATHKAARQLWNHGTLAGDSLYPENRDEVSSEENRDGVSSDNMASRGPNEGTTWQYSYCRDCQDKLWDPAY